MTSFASVDDYIAGQAQAARPVLERVRSAIVEAAPGAAETISYHMPTYRLNGGVVIHFAAWKEHVSLYPASAKLLKLFEKDLAGATINKSTIRFSLAKPVDARLIGRIVKFRIEEQAERRLDRGRGRA